MEEERLSKITEMLLSGGKMLGVHCGKCMSPLFDVRGRVLCPVCKAEARPQAPNAGVETQPLKKVEAALNAKLDSLSEQLARETDHAKVAAILDSIKSTLEAIERLKPTKG
ncbi:MAG: Sjogren's syndrome/scleroderma autoantigen 1 family protein [Candidatus Hadarchaeota archaeon]